MLIAATSLATGWLGVVSGMFGTGGGGFLVSPLAGGAAYPLVITPSLKTYGGGFFTSGGDLLALAFVALPRMLGGGILTGG